MAVEDSTEGGLDRVFLLFLRVVVVVVVCVRLEGEGAGVPTPPEPRVVSFIPRGITTVDVVTVDVTTTGIKRSIQKRGGGGTDAELCLVCLHIRTSKARLVHLLSLW